ncbi:MAG: hypothetical protein RL660_854 [Bacteroidota bacterium]|jgi:hypothetical protein
MHLRISPSIIRQLGILFISILLFTFAKGQTRIASHNLHHRASIGFDFRHDFMNKATDKINFWPVGNIPAMQYSYTCNDWQFGLQFRKLISDYTVRNVTKYPDSTITSTTAFMVGIEVGHIVPISNRIYTRLSAGAAYTHHYYNIIYRYLPNPNWPESFGGTPSYIKPSVFTQAGIFATVLPTVDVGINGCYNHVLFASEQIKAWNFEVTVVKNF